MENSSDVRLGRVQGVLETIAMFNSAADEDYSFSFICFGLSANMNQNVRQYLSSKESIEVKSLDLMRVEDADVQRALTRWLLKFPNPTTVRSVNPTREFAEKLWEETANLISGNRYYKVNFEPIGWYEASWEDFVLEGEKGCFYLHLGVSD